jgi:isoleucyl-tRNA synthetase
LSAPTESLGLLERYRETLRYLFIVSQVELRPLAGDGNGAGLKVEVSPAEGEKCVRCWNYSTHVGEDRAYPTICERCSASVAEILAS